MYNVKWYSADGIYEASGGASANSLFFENKADHQIFLELWERFMSDYVNLVHYSLTEVSWSMIFKTKDATTILNVYNERHKQSKKVKKAAKLSAIGPIISQSIRLFLSNYVVMSNRNLGKDGSRVKRRFTKYAFKDVEDYRARIEVLERMEQLYVQMKQKYRPDESYYDENMELGYRCVHRSGRPCFSGLLAGHFCISGFEVIQNKTSILRSLIQSTLSAQIPIKSPPT